jgi:two-component system, cell cycle sensor histidine kinase DivJ
VFQRVASTIQGSLGGLLPAPDASGGGADARQLWFVGTRLLLGAGGLAALPFYLAIGGRVGPLSALMILGFLVQAGLALLLGRGVGLSRLQALSSLTLCLSIGLAVALAPASALPLQGLCLVLMFEAVLLVGRGGFVVAALGAALVFAAAYVVQLVSGGHDPSVPRQALWLMSGVGVLAASCGLCLLALSQGEAAQARESNLKRHAGAWTDAIGDLVLQLDGAGAVTAVSAPADELSGLPAARDLLGRGLFDKLHVADKPGFLKAVSDARHAGGTRVVALRLQNDGQTLATGGAGPLWLELRCRVVPSEGCQQPAEIIGLLRDISERVAQREALEAARREAAQADRLADRFVATLSHELRTPLGAVVGFAEMLASERLAPTDEVKRRDYAMAIRNSGQHLLTIVDTFLDSAKIEAGTYTITREACSVDTVATAALDMVRCQALKGAVALQLEIEPALPPVHADRRCLLQVLVNLLANAVKFTPPGGTVKLAGRREGSTLALSVSDTGAGIAPEHLGRLGEPFFRAGHSAGGIDGVGLGLSVVRRLLALHGGSLAFDSAMGQGTCATARLNFDARDRLPPVVAHHPAGRPAPARISRPPAPAVKKSA